MKYYKVMRGEYSYDSQYSPSDFTDNNMHALAEKFTQVNAYMQTLLRAVTFHGEKEYLIKIEESFSPNSYSVSSTGTVVTITVEINEVRWDEAAT